MINLQPMTLFESLRSRKLIVPMLAIFIALLIQTSWVEEDAFITLRTSDNLIHGHGLRWNVDERVQTFTNPLWMFLLAGAHAIVTNPYVALILLSILVSALALLVFLANLPRNNFGLLLAFSILFLSKAFVDYSTSGLENPATHLIAACFLVLYFKAEKPLPDKTLFFLSLLAGLAAFNRMDTVLLYLPALVAMFFTRPNRRTLLIMLAGFSPFILWEIFSIVYYGFPFPNTYYAKLPAGVPPGELTRQGLMYFLNSIGWDPITLTMIFSALALTFIGRRREETLLALGVAFYLGYIVYIGGDFMSGRFFTAPLIFSVALLIRRAEDASILEKYTWIGLALALGILLAPLKSYAGPLESDLVTFDNTTGVADERFGYYRYTNLLVLNRNGYIYINPLAEYGLDLRERNVKTFVTTGIGMIGYFAGPQTHIIDALALGDPLLARLPPANLANWYIAHLVREIPDGYIETIESGENKITDPSLAEFYDQLHLIIRGDLWTTERWEAIWKMNTGQYNYLVDLYLDAQK